jgi:hypothetical protein
MHTNYHSETRKRKGLQRGSTDIFGDDILYFLVV